MLGMYKAMPDVHVTIEDMIAESDKVRRNTRSRVSPTFVIANGLD